MTPLLPLPATVPDLRFDAHLGADDGPRAERTRARLCIAACRFLDDNPLGALTVAEVCKAAGVAHGTFYLYFADRHALVGDVLSGFVDFVQQVLRASGRLGQGDRVRNATWAYYHLFAENPGLMKCLLHHMDDFPEAQSAFQRLNREWVAAVVAARRRRQPALLVGDEELTRRAHALGGMVDQYLANLLLRRDPDLAAVSTDPEAVIDTLTTLWTRGFEQ
jgi:AcrR family transcriptional regulator